MSTPVDHATWLQSHLTTLCESESEDSFHGSFDSVFAPGCQVIVNHTPASIDEFKDQLRTNLGASVSAKTSWENVITASPRSPSEDNQESSQGVTSDQASIVAAFVTITRSMKFRIRAAPAQRQSLVHLSAKIEGNGTEEADGRRITSLLWTSVERTPPIHFPTPHAVAAQTGSQE
ncbi:hypothetical protein CONPUDRAFT_81921 [Coniophora puteana RWD-64-598 SS2]|uniref:Uncharacterized protein n=1 Tax=Coniophora puteana (strain RWD-64-598) TaxID=741705 RepID=A0A5M3MTS6_CONPW|nr:uncharacterized protein CONPUDRAFT_81921 [Coniophora puteana RWD-64-598 SS2]EIW82447.1 hypothetical protein CONPUDRAFT_81921 [Coniophora puteana RWD-64-598 SS2]